MLLNFYKYHTNGNDFIIVDKILYPNIILSEEFIKKLCKCHTGVGADGLIMVQHSTNGLFEMIYFNANGKLSTFCGNGARCFVAYLRDRRYIIDRVTFMASDGKHEARFLGNDEYQVTINDVAEIKTFDKGLIIDTGSPHLVFQVINIAGLDAYTEGKKWRNNSKFKPDGINVNFYEVVAVNKIKNVTYERGVENVTLSCGTGSVAAAIAFLMQAKDKEYEIIVETPGGDITVFLTKIGKTFSNIKIKSKVEFVFEGKIKLE
ncbi:MAG: diaminopimelate epimerase [Bacteroidales bacterium]|nr:diaminopimelate epimerase [Bacteroidales bacterium]